MATLEKIRNKSVLLFIIIIVALLAFILGDFLTSGRTYFGHPTTVAKAGGVTVEYQDYQNRLAQAGEQLRNQGRDYSSDVLTQNVVQSLPHRAAPQERIRRAGHQGNRRRAYRSHDRREPPPRRSTDDWLPRAAAPAPRSIGPRRIRRHAEPRQVRSSSRNRRRAPQNLGFAGARPRELDAQPEIHEPRNRSFHI